MRSPWLAARLPLRDFAHAASWDEAKDYVIDQVVPTHGLDKMVGLFKDTTDIFIPDILNAKSRKYWCQLHSAFEVRHLIEHKKGRADLRFIHEVASGPLWKNSSWGNFPLQDPTEGRAVSLAPEVSRLALSKCTRIDIRAEDFDQTYEAMVASADIITASAKEYWPKSGPGHREPVLGEQKEDIEGE